MNGSRVEKHSAAWRAFEVPALELVAGGRREVIVDEFAPKISRAFRSAVLSYIDFDGCSIGRARKLELVADGMFYGMDPRAARDRIIDLCLPIAGDAREVTLFDLGRAIAYFGAVGNEESLRILLAAFDTPHARLIGVSLMPRGDS